MDELELSSANGDLDRLQELLGSEATNYLLAPSTLRRLLKSAISAKHAHVVEFLLDQNPSYRWWEDHEYNIVRNALSAGVNIFRALMARKPDIINWHLGFGQGTTVTAAVKDNNIELLLFLLANGAKAGEPDEPPGPPLLRAVQLDREDCVGILIPHCPLECRVEALKYAVANSRSLRMIQLLVEAGTDVNYVLDPFSFYSLSMDTLDESAFHVAIRVRDEDSVRLFLEHGADWNSCDAKGVPAKAKVLQQGTDSPIFRILSSSVGFLPSAADN
ncbi:hypothetical protein AJ79_01716 [Helicocarpus griseus UAMH5409]|uniref:Uncharacterized protein n=1 Tax=Helicocarpus griseus UAMH5409 TaxID=1447875 RepID=A0A2B7Y674_9EURO|nr:hypothetical protein AJ79_01716 [Helicocarpus griseus UAMH5409]